MPAPSAGYIEMLLNPYKGFHPSESTKSALEIGRQGIALRGQNEEKRQFEKTNERADEYLGMQQHQMEMNQVNRNQDNLMQAFREFNEAVVDGDEERAAAAARNIKALGGNVEEYMGESAPETGGAPPTATPPPSGTTSGTATPKAAPTGTGGAAAAAAAARPPNAMNIGAAESPTAKVAKAKPNVPPAPNAEVPQWLRGDAEKGGYMPPSGLDAAPFQGLPPATLDRPAPAGSGIGTPPAGGEDPTAQLIQNLTPEQRQALLAALSRGMA